VRAIDTVMASADFGERDHTPPEGSLWGGGLLPTAPAQEGITGPLLVALVNQFALVQQQMFDHFQQVILAMMQTMTALHREQADLIHQELAQVGELTRQLCAFHAGAAALPLGATVLGHGVPALPQPDTREPPPAPRSAEAPPAAAEPGDPAIHLWLTQRIAAIQAERQGRLQRVLGLILGRP
jgi:hypothetical protein